jgi:hypothetical protein
MSFDQAYTIAIRELDQLRTEADWLQRRCEELAAANKALAKYATHLATCQRAMRQHIQGAELTCTCGYDAITTKTATEILAAHDARLLEEKDGELTKSTLDRDEWRQTAVNNLNLALKYETQLVASQLEAKRTQDFIKSIKYLAAPNQGFAQALKTLTSVANVCEAVLAQPSDQSLTRQRISSAGC